MRLRFIAFIIVSVVVAVLSSALPRAQMKPWNNAGLTGPPGPGAASNSSIGNASTSVGPGSPIHRSCRPAIVVSSTSSTESSAAGCTDSRSSTCREPNAQSVRTTETREHARSGGAELVQEPHFAPAINAAK